jgi:hypothetical protein
VFRVPACCVDGSGVRNALINGVLILELIGDQGVRHACGVTCEVLCPWMSISSISWFNLPDDVILHVP